MKFKEWFVAERAKALAMVLLTRRHDLVVKETKEENGLDYTVYIKAADKVGNRAFGVYVAAGMAPVTLGGANKQVEPAMEMVQSFGPFPFPVCVFFFTVKDDQGYYAWVYEPVVTPQGEPKLSGRATVHCQKLGNESLEEIVSLGKRWYEKLYATMTSAGNNQLVGAANPEFAALADEFEARVRAAEITGTTEVTLVYRCVDEEGRDLQPVRTSIVPETKVGGMGATGPAFAAASHRDAILGNLNSLVRHGPTGLTLLRDASQKPLRIVGFELEIKDIESPAKGKKRLKAGQA